MTRRLDFPVFDADNHLYEATDAFTKYLPPEYENVIKYVEIKGRTKIAVNNKISEYIPNPTFNVVAPPGAQELEFKLKNPDSMTAADKEAKLEPPPRYIRSVPAYFEPEARVMLMDELGIDRAMMWPTLASLLEERLADDPVATHVVVHAFNQWMHEQWTFNFDDRIFPTPVITLPIVDRAIEELEWVLERGAKAILIRPAPVPDFGGRRRSFALEEFDPFWKRVEEADILVGMHASDDGHQRYLNEWEGHTGEFLPFNQKMSGFSALMHADNRVISDVVASIVGHGLVTRFPSLRIMPVENGSSWVRPLVEKFQKVYARTPGAFDEDPMVAFTRCLFIHPFHEEDPVGLVNLIGADNVLFGSDYPHPEGMYDPVSFVDQLDGLAEDDKAKIMGGNLARIIKLSVAA
ncbi:MAG TPA: amidohydrolase family protein [Acidimicrobiia bacterium]|nr:amidohydrolase family protein [Acidimicrobiia bacterium]